MRLIVFTFLILTISSLAIAETDLRACGEWLGTAYNSKFKLESKRRSEEYLHIEINDPVIAGLMLGHWSQKEISAMAKSTNEKPLRLDFSEDGSVKFISFGKSTEFFKTVSNFINGKDGEIHFFNHTGTTYSVRFSYENYRKVARVYAVPSEGPEWLIFKATTGIYLSY